MTPHEDSRWHRHAVAAITMIGLAWALCLSGCSAEPDSSGAHAQTQAQKIRPEDFLGVVFAGEAPVKASQERPYLPTDPRTLPPLDEDLPYCVRQIYAAMYLNFVSEDNIYEGKAHTGTELDGMVFVCRDPNDDRIYYYPPAVALKPAGLNRSSGQYPPWSLENESGQKLPLDTLQGPVLAVDPSDRLRRELMLFVSNAGGDTIYLQTPRGRISVDDHNFTEVRELHPIWQDAEAVARRVHNWFPSRPDRSASPGVYFNQLKEQQLQATGEILMLASGQVEARRMDEPMRLDLGRQLTQEEINRGTDTERVYGNARTRQDCGTSARDSNRLTRQATIFIYVPSLEALEQQFAPR